MNEKANVSKGPIKRVPKTKGRWKALPPEGEGACDYDPLTDLTFDTDPVGQFRRDAAKAAALEARRLARDYALFDPRPPKLGRDAYTKGRIEEANAAATAWLDVVKELRKRRLSP